MEEDAGFWPAYVAAMAGLIQGILLVLAVMAIALFQVVTVTSAQLESMAKLAMQTPQFEAQTEMEVVFSHWAWRVDETTRKSIETAIKEFADNGAQKWRLALTADLSDALARRAAFLRVATVRNILLACGVPGAQIDLALIDTPGATSDDGMQVVKVQSQAPKASEASEAREKPPR